MKYIFVILALIVLFFSSCDKKTPIPKCKTVSESSPDFLSYWYFPEGSWWVYELKNNAGVYDTVRVVNTLESILEPCKIDCHPQFSSCAQIYQITLRHSNKNFFKAGDVNAPPDEVLIAQTNNLDVRMNLNNNRLPSGSIFGYPIYLGVNFGEGKIFSDTNEVVTPLQTFHNSLHLKIIIPPQVDTINSVNFAKNVFFTKHVGFTKRVYTGNQIWELINYHINR